LLITSNPTEKKKVKKPAKLEIPKTAVIPHPEPGKNAPKPAKEPKLEKFAAVPHGLTHTTEEQELDSVAPVDNKKVPTFKPPKAPVPPSAKEAPAMAASKVSAPVLDDMALVQGVAITTVSGKVPLKKPRMPILATNESGVMLPPIPQIKFGKCPAKAAEYLDCTGGSLIDTLTGNETVGFCLDQDQASAIAGLELRDYTPKLERFRRVLRKFAASMFNVADTRNTTNKFNKEDDHVQLCFLPGSVVEQRRYHVYGNFDGAARLGDAYGMFKPTISVQCRSKYCETAKIVEKGPTNVFINFQP